MKDWLDLEMEREGYTRRRSAAAILREEHLANCDAEGVTLFSRMNSEAKMLRDEHRREHNSIHQVKQRSSIAGKARMKLK